MASVSTTSASLIAPSLLASALSQMNASQSQVETVATSTPKVSRKLIAHYSEEYDVNPEVALRIAFCESTDRQFDKDGGVLRGASNNQDVGLFQINESFHLAASQKMGLDIYTANGNIQYAMRLIKKDGYRHWKSSRSCWQATASRELALAK